METLTPMFPNIDSVTLQHALEAHNNSIERTVDYLLTQSPTTNSTPTSPSNVNVQARRLQEESDAEFARRLQIEQDAHDRAYYSNQPDPTQNQTDSTPFALPSLSDVQSAVKPIVDGVQYAGRVAADSVNSLYREFMAPDHPSSSTNSNRFHNRPHDEAVVVRDEHDPHERNTPRLRRNINHSYGFAPTDKKDA